MPFYGDLTKTYLNQEQTLIYVTSGTLGGPAPTFPLTFLWGVTGDTLYVGPSAVQGHYGNTNNVIIWEEVFSSIPLTELSSYNTLYLSSFRPVNDSFIVYLSVQDSKVPPDIYINYGYIDPLHVHLYKNGLGISGQQLYLSGSLSAMNPLSSNIVWIIEPYDITYDQVWYSNDNTSWTQFDPTLLIPVLSTNRYFQLSSTYEEQQTYIITLSTLSILPDSDSYSYTSNIEPVIVTTNVTNSSVSCDAYYYEEISYNNKWKIVPADGYLDFGIGALGSRQTNTSDTWITTTEGLRITAVNNDAGYSKQYTVLLQVDNSPIASAIFIPFISYDTPIELIIEASTPEYINHTTTSNVYFYQRINNIKSNLPYGVTLIKVLYTAPTGATLAGDYFGIYGEPTQYLFDGSGVLSQFFTPLKLTFYIPEFSTGSPSLTTYVLSAQATFTDTTTTEISIFALSSISVFNWPDSLLFNCDFTVNYNPVNFWRQYTPTDSLTVRDNSTYYSGLSGKYLVDWNGTRQQYSWPSVTASDATSAVNPIANSEFTVTVILSDFKQLSWSNGYTIQEEKIITYVDPFYNSEFITYPSRRWDDVTKAYITITNPFTQSYGATAFGSGTIGTFLASATLYPSVSYKWYVNGTEQSEDSSNLSYTFSTPPDQSTTLIRPVSCKIYDNSLFPDDMPTTYYTDTGIITGYKNFRSTNDSDYLHQHFRMVPFNYATVITLTSVPNIFYIPYETQITVGGNAVTSIGALSAVYGNLTWILRSNNWTHTEQQEEVGGPTNPSFNVEHTFEPLIYGNGWNELTIHPDSNTTTLSVYVTGTVFVSSGRTLSAVYVESIPVSFDVVNLIGRIYTPQKYYTTNSLITVYNTTNHVGLLTSYIWNDGDPAHGLTANDTQSWFVSYDKPGNYDLLFTTIFSGGLSFDYFFNNYITVLTGYDEYSSEIFRTAEFTTIELPHTKNDVYLPPNEWIISENVNKVFNKLQNNLDYLDKVSKIYDSPPVEYLGWYGNSILADEKWHINNGSNVTTFISFFDVIPGKLYSVYGAKEVNDKLYVINRESVLVLDNSVSGNILGETDTFEVNDYFVELKAIDVDSANRIFVLDRTRNLVASMEFNSLSGTFLPLNSWGGLGGPTSKYKFHSPTDMIIDSSDDSVWVVDSQNYTIKHFTNTGNWLNTIFIDLSSKPISVGIDFNDFLHILTDNTVKKYTKDGTYINEYNYERIGDPRKIIATDNGFVYICFSNGIQRYLETGTYSGLFETVYGIIDYRSISYNSTTKNFYVSNIYNILKYVDFPRIIDVKQSYVFWPLSSIYIKPDEYVQDWVYNKSFSRLWESLELFRRSLKGRLGYITENITVTAPYISARERLWTWEGNLNTENCITWDYLDCIINTYTWEQIQNLRNCGEHISYVYASGSQILAYNKFIPTIFNFTPVDITQLIWSKSDILIGINELVTYDVFNRCVNQLYDNEQILFDMVK